jgi:hypothetical protein
MNDKNKNIIENDDSANFQSVNYNICSIYYDMLNAPLNIDIKKVISHIITNNTKKHTIFIIRVLKHKNILQKLYDNILNENEIKFNLTFHGMITSHPIDIRNVVNIINKCPGTVEANKIKVDSIVFITSNYMDIIKDINKKIYMVTDFEKINSYNSENVVSINYNEYLVDDLRFLKNEIKEYDKYNWHNVGTGNSLINKRVFYQLNMFIEALNTEKLDFACLKYYKYPINMEWAEQRKYIEQYVLLFDYKNSL